MDSPLLKYSQPLLEGVFLRRYKRFTVEAQIDGRVDFVHTNNTGRMQGLLAPGSRILVSRATNPARKMAYTLECVEAGGVWCGVNTSVPNRMLKAAFEADKLPFANGYAALNMERSLPAGLALEGENSRLDALFSGGPDPDLWVECKNVTLVKNGVALFPDAATARGCKHLRQLIKLRENGLRAACFFLVQRSDAQSFAPAAEIDPEYARLFREAARKGVEMYPYMGIVSAEGIELGSHLTEE